MDYSPPGIYLSMGILQARILEWVATRSSRGSSQPMDQIQLSRIAGRFFTVWATRGSDSAHVWIEEINTLLPEADPSRRCFARLKTLFYFTSSLPLPLYFAFWLLFFIASLSLWCCKIIPSIQAPIRCYFETLPSSQSASFPNKVVFFASTPCLLASLACSAVSRASLDSVTWILEKQWNFERGLWIWRLIWRVSWS